MYAIRMVSRILHDSSSRKDGAWRSRGLPVQYVEGLREEPTGCRLVVTEQIDDCSRRIISHAGWSRHDDECGCGQSNDRFERTVIAFRAPGAEAGAAKDAEGALAASRSAETAQTAQEVAGTSSKTAAGAAVGRF